MTENALSSMPAETDTDNVAPQMVLIALDDLEADPEQGRKRVDAAALDGLAKSIRECGVLEPILVQPRSEGSKHRIIAGERRWRAARMAGLQSVPCIVRGGARPALEQLVENFQREDLDAVAKADQLRRTMVQTGMDAREVANRAGLGYATVLQYLRLAEGPDVLRKAVSTGLRVEVDDENVTRVLDWTHGLEALRIYRAVLEPTDPGEKKRKAQLRLEALLRRALAEDWNRKRWLACAATMIKERRRARGASTEATTETASTDAPAPKTNPPPDPPRAVQVPANDPPPEPGTPHPGDLLATIDSALQGNTSAQLEAAATRVEDAIAALDHRALYCRRERQLVVYLDRLTSEAEATRRSELIREVDAVLAAVRRIRPGRAHADDLDEPPL